MKYFQICITCGKDYEIESDPKNEQEWKNIQSQIGKRSGLCTTCANTNYCDDGSMDLKEIAEKYNAVFSLNQDGSIEVNCPPGVDPDMILREVKKAQKKAMYKSLYGSMDVKSKFVSSDGQYIFQADTAALYDRAMAVDLKAITEKYNVQITTTGPGQEGIDILCDAKDVEAIKQDMLSHEAEPGTIKRIHINYTGARNEKYKFSCIG